jgi:hypothetical protein
VPCKVKLDLLVAGTDQCCILISCGIFLLLIAPLFFLVPMKGRVPMSLY